MPGTVLIAYATHDGHTRTIATHLADALRGHGLQVTVHDVASGPIDPAPFDRVVVASPVHVGHHERALVDFVKTHRLVLDAKQAALLSVGVSEASVEQSPRPEQRERSAAAGKSAVEAFFKETGWTAAHVEQVAGALAYRKYNWLIRFIMKRIAKGADLSTDTSKDHDYTNWAALDRFAAGFEGDLSASPTAAPRS